MASDDPIARALAHREELVLDGGLATDLERRGADLDDPLWSARLLLERPALIREVHADYLAAGADVVTTASYQATFEGFARRGLGADAAAALLRLSVVLAREARDAFQAEAPRRAGPERPLVAASIGPYGAMRADGSEYRGGYGLSIPALMDFHRPRMAVLAQAGADLLACETVPCLDEALALARLLPEFPHARAWISFSCRDGLHVSEGQRLADCVAALDGHAQVAAVGVNCTAPEHVESLVRQARACTRKPIVAYPNSGERYDAACRCWRGESDPSAYAVLARRWQAAGARLIGGCCRTTPEHVRALRAAFGALDGRRS